MKKISLLLYFFPICLTTQAQIFSGGITASISTASVKMSEINDALANAIEGENITGFEAGIFGRANFDPLFVKAMPMISYQSGQVDITNLDGTEVRSDFNTGRFEIPVMFGLRIVGPLRIEAGPVYNWLFRAEPERAKTVNVRESGFGYRVGASIELWRINVGIAYQGLKHTSNNRNTTTFRSPTELIFSLGFLVGPGFKGNED